MLETVIASWGCMASKEKSQYDEGCNLTVQILELNREWVFPFASLMVGIRNSVSHNLQCQAKRNARPKN